MRVIAFDDPDILLPLLVQPIPGLDHIRIYRGQVVRTIEHERRRDPFAATGGSEAGLLELIRNFDDLFDLPLHGGFLLVAGERPERLSGHAKPPASSAGPSRLWSTAEHPKGLALTVRARC